MLFAVDRSFLERFGIPNLLLSWNVLQLLCLTWSSLTTKET